MGAIAVERSEPGVAVVSLIGEHEAYTAPKLELELALLQFDRYSIVVDLSETAFIDSAIVSVLLRARDNSRAAGRKFALVLDDSTGIAVIRLFDVTGLREVFATGSTPRAALDAA
jgi:anti-anti-sigma factor